MRVLTYVILAPAVGLAVGLAVAFAISARRNRIAAELAADRAEDAARRARQARTGRADRRRAIVGPLCTATSIPTGDTPEPCICIRETGHVGALHECPCGVWWLDQIRAS